MTCIDCIELSPQLPLIDWLVKIGGLIQAPIRSSTWSRFAQIVSAKKQQCRQGLKVYSSEKIDNQTSNQFRIFNRFQREASSHEGSGGQEKKLKSEIRDPSFAVWLIPRLCVHFKPLDRFSQFQK